MKKVIFFPGVCYNLDAEFAVKMVKHWTVKSDS